MASDLISLGRHVLAQQPFSVMLDARLEMLEPGQAAIRLAITPALLQQHGFVHGGVISYLADNALTFAGGSVLGDCVTVEIKVNYLRPAQGAGSLLAMATVAGNGKSQAVCRCDVFVVRESERVLVAVAQGTIQRVT
jgi:uncharacterized protein (TIGR00369 family)